jgi:hypothetical protein
MRMRRFNIAIPCGLALGLGLAACQASREQIDQPPNARSLIMVHKAILWRDLESIRNASIAAPQRHAGGWRVCVRLDTKGAFGSYTGERDYLVALYGADRRPELVMEDVAAACAAEPHVPFPELEGGYGRLESEKKSKATIRNRIANSSSDEEARGHC